MDPIEPWVDREELRRMADSLLAPPERSATPTADATYGEEFEGYAGEAAPPDVREAPPGASTPTSPEIPASGGDPGTVPTAAEQHARQALAAARDIARRGGLLGGAAETEESEAVDRSPPTPDAETTGAPAGPPKLTQVSPVPGLVDSGPAPAQSPPVRRPFMARLQAYGTWLRDGIAASAFFVLDRAGGVLIDEVQSAKLQQVARTLAQASHTANRQAGAAAIGNLHVKIAPDAILEVVPVMTRCGPLILGIIVQQPLTAGNVEAVARGLQQVIDGDPGAHSP